MQAFQTFSMFLTNITKISHPLPWWSTSNSFGESSNRMLQKLGAKTKDAQMQFKIVFRRTLTEILNQGNLHNLQSAGSYKGVIIIELLYKAPKKDNFCKAKTSINDHFAYQAKPSKGKIDLTICHSKYKAYFEKEALQKRAVH